MNHLEEVRLLITRYKPKAQCRDIQTSENCIPKGCDIHTELIEPTINTFIHRAVVLWLLPEVVGVLPM